MRMRLAAPTRAGVALLGVLFLLATPSESAAATAEGQPEAFFIGSNGGLDAYGLLTGGTWSAATQVGAAGLAPAGAAVTATPIQDGSVAAFFSGSNGAVYAGCPGQAQTVPVTASGVALAGGSIGAALAGTTVMIVFAGAEGGLAKAALISNPCIPPVPKVAVTTVLDSASWAEADGQLAVIGLSDGELGVFCFDRTGAGRALWLSPGGTWSESVILPAGTASSGGSVAVSPNAGASPVSLFYIGAGGSIYLASPLVGGGLASTPQPDPATSSATVPPDAGLAASSSPDETTASFVADNGAVEVLPVNAEGDWQSTVLASAPGFAAPGAPLASTATSAEIDIYGGTESGSPGHIAYLPAAGSCTWLASGPSGMTTAATDFAAAS
jgi:hypothetical protein